ncbi:MAG: HNH endonuclease [Actinomycetota bacterium]
MTSRSNTTFKVYDVPGEVSYLSFELLNDGDPAAHGEDVNLVIHRLVIDGRSFNALADNPYVHTYCSGDVNPCPKAHTDRTSAVLAWNNVEYRFDISGLQEPRELKACSVNWTRHPTGLWGSRCVPIYELPADLPSKADRITTAFPGAQPIQGHDPGVDLNAIYQPEFPYPPLPASGRALPLGEKWAGKRRPISDIWTKTTKTKYPDLAEHYPNGVQYTMQGYPDFSEYAVAIYKMQPGQMRDKRTGPNGNFAMANGWLKSVKTDWTPSQWSGVLTWHEHESCLQMLLVPTDIHDAVRHNGGVQATTHGFCQFIEP